MTGNDPLQLRVCFIRRETHLTINHALITGSWFIHQTSVPVSLELKDTEVRAYRTDPVQGSNIDYYEPGHANLLCIVPILSDVPEGTSLIEDGIFININVLVTLRGVGLQRKLNFLHSWKESRVFRATSWTGI
ncbi:hypothetical protein VNO80_03685 [Phaseolus coccineus]|uniref:Uncharacterized protein n=1 Tax=Phaseolus coccineus TaxID=3886 RepID=A0AAN9NWJ3_PHACN